MDSQEQKKILALIEDFKAFVLDSIADDPSHLETPSEIFLQVAMENWIAIKTDEMENKLEAVKEENR